MSLLFNNAMFALLIRGNHAKGSGGGSSVNTIGASIRASAVQAAPNNATTTVSFDTTDFDTSSFVAALPATNLVIPFSGLYFANAIVSWAANIAAGTRILELFKNGVQITSTNLASNTTNAPTHSLSCLLNLTVGDLISLSVFQNSGGSVNLNGGASDITFFQLFGFH